MLTARRLEQVPADRPNAQRRLARAEEKLDAARKIAAIDTPRSRRIITRVATAWRLGHDDYLEATARLPVDHLLALTGRPEPTPRDARLQTVMIATDVAVHEEAIVDLCYSRTLERSEAVERPVGNEPSG
ncbi:MAG: DUF2399 domain-containing protein [Jatrophihabitans sp.]